MQKSPQNKPIGALPPEPKRDQFEDEESFLEARDSWRHRVGPIKRLAAQANAEKDKNQNRR
jgi:hypothetical protein